MVIRSKMQEDGVERASILLSDILKQMVLNDSPPTNEFHKNPPRNNLSHTSDTQSELSTKIIPEQKSLNNEKNSRTGSTTQYSTSPTRRSNRSSLGKPPQTPLSDASTFSSVFHNKGTKKYSRQCHNIIIDPNNKTRYGNSIITGSTGSVSSQISATISNSQSSYGPIHLDDESNATSLISGSTQHEHSSGGVNSIVNMGHPSLSIYMMETLDKIRNNHVVSPAVMNKINTVEPSMSQVSTYMRSLMQLKVPNGSALPQHTHNKVRILSPPETIPKFQRLEPTIVDCENGPLVSPLGIEKDFNKIYHDEDFEAPSDELLPHIVVNDDGDEESDSEENAQVNQNAIIFGSPKRATGLNSIPTSPTSQHGRYEKEVNTFEFETESPRRIQMFGSEYAKFLSSSLFTPSIPRKKKSIMQSLSRIKEHTTSSNQSITSSTQASESSTYHRLGTSTTIDELEEAAMFILTGPITDMIVTHGNEIPPRGFYRISLSADGHKADLSQKRGTTSIYLNVKKESNWDRAAQRPCVTAIALVFPDRKEFVPPGFIVVKSIKAKKKTKKMSKVENESIASSSSQYKDSTIAANLNYGTKGERVFLCYKKSREGNPITGIMPLLPNESESVPDGYTVLERTPRNFVADVNSGAGPPVFLAFRQRLSNLETLRPPQLILPHIQNLNQNSSSREKSTLQAYYCTGGTTVESDVGIYHIMDRSTHTMLSPSSVTTRLTLIQSSSDMSGTAAPFIPHNISNRSRTHSVTSRDSRSTDSHTYSFSLSDRNFEMIDVEDESHPPELPTNQAYHSMYPYIPTVMDGSGRKLADSTKIDILTPILTSCYTHHGGAAMVAVEGLSQLLNETDFFQCDLRKSASMTEEDENILTLLDLSIQTVCDVATSSCRETYFKSCVDFVGDALRISRGHLSTRTLGYALRFYHFVFYFGASLPTLSSWPHTIQSTGYGVTQNDFILLLEPEFTSISAPQASVLLLKEMITLLWSLLDNQEVPKVKTNEACFKSKGSEESSIVSFIGGLLTDVVSKSMDRVDVSAYTQLAAHQIQGSGGSEVFWYDMISSCGFQLFGKNNLLHVVLFAVMANFVRVANVNMRKRTDGRIVHRDLATKLFSLELIQHFLICANNTIGMKNDVSSQKSKENDVFAYTIRRLIVPCLLNITTSAFEDPRIFKRILKIITILWCNYRSYLKVEIAILFEHFMLRVLRVGPQLQSFEKVSGNRICLEHQLDVINEIERWFSNPHDLLELFSNYDMDEASSVTHWKACQHICAALCKLSEKCGEIIVKQINSSRVNDQNVKSGDPAETTEYLEKLVHNREAARSLQEKSLDLICHIVRLLTHASYKVFKNKSQDSSNFMQILNSGSWDNQDRFEFTDFDDLLQENEESDDSDDEQSRSSEISDNSIPLEKTHIKNNSAFSASSNPFRLQKYTTGRTQSEEATDPNDEMFDISMHLGNNMISFPPPPPPLPQTIKVSERKADQKRTEETLHVAFEIVDNNGLKKALDYLIACNFLLPGPRDVASFLRIHQKRLDPSVLGEYLGEGGHAGDGEYWNLVRYHYVRAISFSGMNLVQALRLFLTSCRFRLPGEAQKIDRIITTFSQCYWEDNAGDQNNCPLRHKDAVFLLSFAIIMLNTDLHRANMRHPSIKVSSSQKKKERKKMTRQEFINNVRGADNTKNLTKEYLTEIYDSIENQAIALHGSPTQERKAFSSSPSDWFTTSYNTNFNSMGSFLKNVKPALELLRGLSVHEHTFLKAREDKTVLSGAFLHLMFKSIWHHFYGIVNASLDAIQLDPQSIGSCLSILKFAICTTIFLDMGMERTAFITQLARIKYLQERGLEDGARIGLSLGEDRGFNISEAFKGEKWYDELERFPSAKECIEAAVEKIHSLTRELRKSMQIDSKMNRAMCRVTRRIRNGGLLLSDPTRTFIREGELLKRNNRSGRFVLYQFFLFSDLLIYAKESSHGDFKIHGQLPLYLMNVKDVRDKKRNGKTLYCFQIQHPKKGFLVVAPNAKCKSRWIKDIINVIRSCLGRKAGVIGSDIGSAV